MDFATDLATFDSVTQLGTAAGIGMLVQLIKNAVGLHGRYVFFLALGLALGITYLLNLETGGEMTPAGVILQAIMTAAIAAGGHALYRSESGRLEGPSGGPKAEWIGSLND